MKSLASNYLVPELLDTRDLEKLEVNFVARGDCGKFYPIPRSGHSTNHVLCMTLPIIPYHRIEGELAVSSQLKKHTSTLVARAVAWKSSAATELAFVNTFGKNKRCHTL